MISCDTIPNDIEQIRFHPGTGSTLIREDLKKRAKWSVCIPD